MSNKIYKKLPVVLQTTAIKNFFESTVEQLFSKANVEVVSGYIGSKTLNDSGITGYVSEPNNDKAHYALSPVVNTINYTTKESEDFIFFDELIDILSTYGVDTTNQNKIFGSNFYSFVPPIDIDKFVNYQEYYWYPEGPTVIPVAGTLTNPIDIDRDVVGKQYYTPIGGTPFKNSMVVRFTGQFVIPSNQLEIDFIVQGVGESIYLVPRRNQFQTVFSTPVDAPYDGSFFPLNHPDIAHQAGNISSVTIVSQGIGYVNPTVSFIGSNANIASATANVAANGAITGIDIVDSGQGYTNFVTVQLTDIDISYNIDSANLFTGASNVITTQDIFVTADAANVRIGQGVSGIISGIVADKHDAANVEGYFGDFLTVPTANVNTATETFTVPNHGLQTDDEVVYDAGGGTPITGVSNGGRYQVLVVNANSFQLKDPSNASAITAITDTGNNSQGFIKRSTVFTVTAVNSGSLEAGMILNHNDLVFKTKIVSQTSGTTGGVGVYEVDVENNTVHTFPETFTVNSTVVLASAVTFEKEDAEAAPTLAFTGRDFLAEVNYEWQGIETNFTGSISGTTLTVNTVGNGAINVGMILGASGILLNTIITAGSGSSWTINKPQSASLSSLSDFVGYPAGSRLGINPATGQYYLMGGQYAYDKNDLDDDEFDGDALWDAGISVSPPEYLTVQRGAPNKNIWSTINFWYHRDNFKDAGMELPNRQFRAERPIIEFDRRLELYEHGKRGVGSVTVASTQYSLEEVVGLPTGLLIDSTPIERQTIIFPSEQPDVAKYVYVAFTDLSTDTIRVDRAPHPELNPIGAVDGDFNFVPWELAIDDVVLVRSGASNIGAEYRRTITGLALCQRKLKTNQAPLFNLYDTDGDYLGDEGKYPNNNFEGNRIFSYIQAETGQNDRVLGFPLRYKAYKASSEIEYAVEMAQHEHRYIPFGGTEQVDFGYKFYKLEKETGNEFLSHMVPAPQPATQRLISKYDINQFDVDEARREFWIGCVPNLKFDGTYDVIVSVNGVKRIDWQYGVFKEGYIVFDSFDPFAGTALQAGDYVEISAASDAGQLLINASSITKYELPLSWKNNPLNRSLVVTSSPEYTQHFKNFMERQDGFQGDALQVNNFSSTPRDPSYATDIVFTDQDIILGALLLDDQPHNLVDAIRFNAEEYMKYKARLKKEISSYYALFDVTGLSNEFILEKVLQNIVSYNIGKNVFNRTYIIPYGDNYQEVRYEINDVNTSEFVSEYFADLNKIENSLLVYYINASTQEKTLLNIDADYTISSYNPITVKLTTNVSVDLDDEIVLKLYDKERDSAQCPPTPSTMGIYPLFEPRIETDNSFQTPIQVLVGHDGSKTTLLGDRRDNILLEFEKRVFNSAKAEFRAANALPDLNIYTLKPGVFRNTGYTTAEWSSLMRYYFSNWAVSNKIDFVTNEFYDADNEWTWNYRGATELPGHWRGWFEYYYDTVRPHTHPWEMLAFFEKPLWWDSQYGTNYSSSNTAMWEDLEDGIIRQGARENISDDRYLLNNSYRRIGLHEVIPVDTNGNLKTPKEIISTGVSTKVDDYTNANADLSLGYPVTSYLNLDGVNVSFDGNIGAGNIYVHSRGLVNHPITIVTNAVGHNDLEIQDASWSIPRIDLNVVSAAPTTMPDFAVGVAVNGLPLYNISTIESWNDEGEWHYNKLKIESHSPLGYGHVDANGLLHYYNAEPILLGLEEWDSTNHSPIIGWAFDGLPIYGPYGYKQYNNAGLPVDANDITNIKSPWKLRQGTRTSGPGGAYTGVFVEDYEIDASKIGQSGYTNQYNLRYGTTPDSPSTPIRFYVSTIDDNSEPMFPYTLAGGYKNHGDSTKVWAGEYYAAGADLDNNTLSRSTFNTIATPALTSTFETKITSTNAASNSWKFSDGAPAENAWKYTEAYPFAVTEAMLLARPGKFATEFADPTKLYRPAANKKYKLSTEFNLPWKFNSNSDLAIHGDTDTAGEFTTNIGYTHFINTWLKFQSLSPVTDFVTKVRTLNTKLGHRMSGFIDKDTMTLRTDQYSNDGSASSLIIPKENIKVLPHSSPYKSRNFYSGVIIEKTVDGYKIRGYDKNLGYFNILESDTTKGREKISVGGTPAKFVDYSQNTNYKAGTLVRHRGAYYSAKEAVKTGTTFDASKWTRLGALPQIGAASGTLYQKTTGNVIKVDYETVYSDVDELFDFLISLGRYQASQGYTFGNFDENIGEVRDWAYAAKQLLFWTTGSWEIGNTLELSPMANKVTFVAPRGFIAKINRSDRSQFNIVDQTGIAINPSDCTIVRQDNLIEIQPPEGSQIYGAVLFTKEIEHAFVLDNVTNFNDIIYNSLINQGHSRLKIKTTRTANWDGRFLSEGFIIGDEELKPNLDNMAESLGRYHELGFIPVEKQLYEASRALFGFEKRSYLTELDILDDQQYDFYTGMLQNKGTTNSLSKIGVVLPALSRSPSSDISIYDEWALRVADFGDVNQDQSIELKLDRSDIIQDPQLITLAFPEDTTNIVEKIEVLERRHRYFNIPQIVVSAPVFAKGIRATAVATLTNSGELDRITVTNPGSGYGEIVGVTVIAGNIVIQQDDIVFDTVRALSTDYISTDSANLSGNLTITDFSGSSNVTTTVDLSSGISSADDVVDAINSANTGVTAYAIRSDVNIAGSVVDKYTLELRGNSFTIDSADANLYLDASVNAYQNGVLYTATVGSGYRYETVQRYGFETANNTIASDITVSVNNNVVSSSEWEYDKGDRWQINTGSNTDAGNPLTVILNTGIVNGETTIANENYTTISNNNYPFVDVYVNNVLIENRPEETIYSLTANTVEFANISLLPKTVLTSLVNPATTSSRFVLSAGSNVYVVEKGTIDFKDSFKDDVTGAAINILVQAHDNIAIKLGTRRNFEITPDAQDDDIILIDIDDASRFLKRPTGVRENNLWPTLTDVDAYGLTTEKYPSIPNSGYVNPSNINFMAYNISSLPDLFDQNVIIKPAGGSLIHMAEDESSNWNVYTLESIGSRISFVETEQGTNEVALYTDRSLFDFLDTNQIGESNTSRYMDYYLTLKNADVSDNVVIWTNESIVQQKQLLIKNPQPPKMIEARIKSIGPKPESVVGIANIIPVSSRVYKGATVSASDSSNIVTISDLAISNIQNGDAVQLVAGESTDFTFNANVTFNSVGNVTVDSANTTLVTASSFVTLLCDGDSTANGNIYFVKSVDTGNSTFVIESDYFADSGTVSGLGNVRYITSTFVDYGGVNDSLIVSNTSTSSFTVELAGVTGGRVNVRHMNLSKIETSANHNITTGEVIKIYANAWTGSYVVNAVPSANTFIISAPYTTDDNTTGVVLKRGLQIKTTDPHGITSKYVENNKRVAVHFASPKSYNRVFKIDSVGSDTINIDNEYTVGNATNIYFDVSSGFANSSSNVITITNRPLLQSTTVLYASNTQLVAYNDYYIEEGTANTTVTFSNDVLFSDANVSTGFVIIREPAVIDFRYPVVTTVDHTQVSLNNSVININSFNNAKGMVANIKRSIDLRRRAISQDSSGKLNVGFNFFEDFKTPVYVPNTNIQGRASKINNYGPYLQDSRTIDGLFNSTANVSVAGSMVISDTIEYEKDPNFNTGPVYVGPIKGMRYYDNGVLFYWDIKLKKYIPIYESIGRDIVTGLEFESSSDVSVSDGSEGNSGATALGDEDFTPPESSVPPLPQGHIDGGPVLILVPGTAETNPSGATKGVKRLDYDMSETVTYSSVSYPRWRLRTSEIWQFEVYEAVENDSGTVYYILVDVVPADLSSQTEYDYFATVSAYNNFNQHTLEDVYYVTDTTWTSSSQDKASANAINYRYIEIPPVEPAFFVGRQIIPEPFAIQSGNGTDKRANFNFLPKDVIIGSTALGNETHINITTPGHNSFLMWQPGLTPGKWTPQSEGPGLLDGPGSTSVPWGFGSGYYATDDSHRPTPATGVNPYPGFNDQGWNTRQPRFKYSKQFSVFPLMTPENSYTLFVDGVNDPQDQTFTGIRPDEIFVACFWTEPYTYVNQMVGFDYTNLDNNGNPTPLYRDYQGTVARVKYIRLTELPFDAVLRRPIADTGWGGKRWKNIVTDEVALPGENLSGQLASPESYGAFDPSVNLVSGSTGDEDELASSIAAPSATRQNTSQLGLGRGFGRGTPTPYSAVTIVSEDNRDVPAPILTGGVLEGLPSACDIRAKNPRPPATATTAPCNVRPTVTKNTLLTEKTDDVGVDEEHIIKIQGKNPLWVFFDFSYDDGQGSKSVNGITIEQSETENFNSGVKRFILDTQVDGSVRAETNGSQIGRYGFDNIPVLNSIIYKPAENALGVLTQDVRDNPLNKYENDRVIAATATNQTTGKVVGVSGFGFLVRTIDCSQGEFIRFTVSKGAANKTGKYAIYVRYFGDAPASTGVTSSDAVTSPDPVTSPGDFEETNNDLVIEACNESGSRAYKNGGILTQYTFTKKGNNGLFGTGIFGKKGNTRSGYFGVNSKTTGFGGDNIYYPYSAPTAGMINAGVDRSAYAGSGATKVVSTINVRTFSKKSTMPEYTTFELKGYMYAPGSGTYNFEIETDDAGYLWVSDADDLSGEEKYKADGNHPELGNKAYNWSNAVAKVPGVHRPEKNSGSVYLKGGGYYFVRAIFGNGNGPGMFNITVKGPGVSGPITFASRSCPEDDCGKFLAGQLPQLDPVLKAMMERLCADTPTFNSITPGSGTSVIPGRVPGGGDNSVNYGNFGSSGAAGGPTGRSTFGGFVEIFNTQLNFAGFSQPSLTGYNFMPSSFKQTTKKKLVDPQQYGYSQTLDTGRYVNATHQRVSGGFTIPLAKALTIVPRTSQPLQSFNVADQPWYKLNAKSIGDLNTTLRAINYIPKKVSTDFILNGVPVNNITTEANTVDGNNSLTITTLNQIPATISVDNEPVVQLGPIADIPFDDVQVDAVNITYTSVPTINITPLTYGANGEFVAVGPTAVTNILRPTPQVKIDGNNLRTVAAGTELFFNDARVIFVAGTTPRDLASQIKCNQSGLDALVQKNSDGTESLVVRSCTDDTFAIKNGCGGGTLKRVGDFHVVRGFEQTTTTTNTESCSSNAAVLPATTGFLTGNVTSTSLSETLFTYGGDGNVIATQTTGATDSELSSAETTFEEPEASYTLYDCGGNSSVFSQQTQPNVGIVLPSTTTSTSTSSTFQNGGSGYQIGDRLRLLGGTPTNNTRGPIGSLCIAQGGAGYNNPANIRISFGGDNSVGVGASAEATSIDEVTGAITGIRLLNYGIGYDVKNPPSVTVIDISPRGAGTYSTIDASNLTGDTYFYNNILEVVNSRPIDNSIIASGSTFYRVIAESITIGAVTTIDSANVSSFEFVNTPGQGSVKITVVDQSLISGKLNKNGIITLLVTGNGTDTGNIVEDYVDGVAFTVSSVDGANVFINDSFFTAELLSNISVLEFSLREPVESAIATGALRQIADQRMGVVPAEITAKVGVADRESSITDPNDISSNPYAFIQGYSSLAGPLRVAKFIVTGVDDKGAITSLRIIDRGLYKVFPADLTQGIPLEYDYDFIGSPGTNSTNLGVVDPSMLENTPYGPGHPEYAQAPFVNSKHPAFSSYTEFRFDPITQTSFEYKGSPGAYDPNTQVSVNGNRLAKQYDIILDPLDPDFGSYATPLRVAGGTGARVFLTADEVPDCSEKGRAKEDLGLPDTIGNINVPEALADALNNALTGAGYLPNDISVKYLPTGPGVGKLKIVSSYPSINVDTNTPGFPEKLGIEIGDYNAGMLCIEAQFVEPNLTDSQLSTEYEKLYESAPFGLLSNDQINQYLSTEQQALQVEPPTILSLLCVDAISTDPNSPLHPVLRDSQLGDSQLQSDSGDGDNLFVNELYKYNIKNIFGESVRLTSGDKQNVNVYAFLSQRYANVELYNEEKLVTSNIIEPVEDTDFELANVWIDSYTNQDTANISMPDFIPGGWAYLENGIPQRWQTPLVDTNYVKNVITYDPDTGTKTTQFDFWDPFKGVLPGFIQNEIHFIVDIDPVNYNNARTNFGLNNVGKVWWDTSTIKYMWYEQGSNRERWLNWGRTFPGSSVTICEWVESKSLPQNWNGNGTPRWPDKYISERRLDPETGKFVTYYYYWVQNRTVLDNRIKRSLNREFDVETIARYIANPVGYGLTMVSFISDESFVLHNISNTLKDENILQININRNNNSDGIKHTSWKLIRENDNTSIIPDHLSDKLIDSICGENAIGQAVPDTTLSEVERYGISFRPRQTMFKDLKNARTALRSIVNNLLIDLKLETQFSSWDSTLPNTLTYLERADWNEVERVDRSDNTKVRYDSSYKPVFNVGSVSELYTLKNLPDGTVIQVRSSPRDRAQLWMYVAKDRNFKLISIKLETLQIKSNIESASTDAVLVNELRVLMNILRRDLFDDIGLWNKVFFELLKYAYVEQEQLSWAFKTSYLYIEKDEEDLIPTNGFKPDNFARVIEYINEVKPFTAKIREYRDGKRAPIETIGATMVSDFDKPPYVDRSLGVVRVLDDFSQNDANIMFLNNAYSNYFSISNKGNDVFRHNNTTLVFDRTNYQLTQFGHNASTTPINLSIARNIANLNVMTEAQITANVQMRAIDRIFKFDPEVRLAFAAEVSSHYNNITAGSNTSITTNAAVLYDIINEGNLAITLNLVKEKVGGGWRGETIDANLFSKVVYGLDPTDNFLSNFGWDTDPWDAYAFDRTVEVFNYEGIFSELTQGNITLRRNNDTYEGFDGATFKKVLYGEERPEEMALLDPLETLIIDVFTSPYASGNTSTTPVAPDAVAVKYRMHQNLFGDTEFIRITDNRSSQLTASVYSYSTEITVADGSVFQTPRPGDPGIIWVGTERILYERKDGNVISQLTRGSAGTTIQDHLIEDIYGNAVSIIVVEGSEEETFNRLDTNRAVWLEVGSEFFTFETYNVSSAVYANVEYAETGNANSFARANMSVSSANATVGANQLTITTTANAVSLLNVGGVVAIAADGNLLTAEGTSYTTSYSSNVTFFFIKSIDSANSTITVEDDLFLQDGMWDYYAFDSYPFDEDITEIIDGNVTVTLEIPTLNAGANTALSLSDVANADYANTESLMTFIHGI